MAPNVQLFRVVFTLPGELNWCLDHQRKLQQWLTEQGDLADPDLPEVDTDLPAIDAEASDLVSRSEIHLTWGGIRARSPWAALQRAGATIHLAMPELLAVPYARLEVETQTGEGLERSSPQS